MNPLSPLTYYRRHKGQAALLLGLVCAATVGLYLLGGLGYATFIFPEHSVNMFLKNYSIVAPASGDELDPTVVSQIQANPDVARVVWGKGDLEIEVPDLTGGDEDLYLFGVQEDDIPYVIEKNGLTLKEGRLLRPMASEIILAEKVAAALDLHVGDVIERSLDTDLYDDILEPMEVVGILGGDVRLAIVPYEYLENHERYRHEVFSGLLVAARPGRENAVDDFLVNEIQSRRTLVNTYQLLKEQLAEDTRQLYFFATPLSILVAVVTTFVIGAVNQIAFTQRLAEFGILHAAGHSKRRLMRRVTLESAAIAITGWAVGVVLSWLILYVLGVSVYAPRGHDLNPGDLPLLLPVILILIPATVVGFTAFSAKRTFARLDAVAIVERGELSTEKTRPHTAAKSSPKPLAASTFYRRHRRRAAVLIAAMATMIMAVALLIFYLAVSEDAQSAYLGDLRRMSLVYSDISDELPPGVATQIRTHPAVERVILTHQFIPLEMAVPPFQDESISAYAVSEEDMAYLVDLYGLQLKEGRLPLPHTNEIVISEVTAQNRDLAVGDVIGSYDHPIYEDAPVLPAELVVSGIFAKPAAPKDENWLSFASLEFVDSHEVYAGSSRRVLVVPKVGQKDALDEWLESEIASDEIAVRTYERAVADYQTRARTMLLTMGLIESAIAIVAAISLAVLNHLFISQRQSEFGVLHALGLDRLALVWRTTREAFFTTATAWGISVTLCLIALLYLQFGIFTPLGLRFNLLNPLPWLFTLPIPVVVLAVTSGTIAWALAKLDPVTIIERR